MTHMIKTRQEIKEIAKDRLRANRGPAVGIYLICMIVSSVLGSVTAGFGAVIVMPVLYVSMAGFFLGEYDGKKARVNDWFATLFDRFLEKLGGYLWMMLWTVLWTMLFWVPGIIKGISYSMTPFILAECPQVKPKEALRLSMRMTQGYKMDIFVAELSFVGWILLSALTLGVLQILHVGPYMETTLGGIYRELKENAIANGTIQAAEFGAAE